MAVFSPRNLTNGRITVLSIEDSSTFGHTCPRIETHIERIPYNWLLIIQPFVNIQDSPFVVDDSRSPHNSKDIVSPPVSDLLVVCGIDVDACVATDAAGGRSWHDDVFAGAVGADEKTRLTFISVKHGELFCDALPWVSREELVGIDAKIRAVWKEDSRKVCDILASKAGIQNLNVIHHGTILKA